MGNKMACRLVIILFGVVVISLITHAGTYAGKAPAKSIPEMLTESGFKAYPAETSQEVANLKSFPTGKLMIHQQIGRMIYCFVAPGSNIMYMGNYSAYQNFQDLLEKQRQEIKKQIREGNQGHKTSEENQGIEIKEKRIESDKEFWNIWGRRYFGY